MENRSKMPGSPIKRRAVFAAVPASILSRAALRIAFAAVLAALALACVRLYAESANTDYKRGQEAEAHQDYDTALADYQKAATRDPKDLRYRIALMRVRTSASAAHVSKGRKLLEAGNTQGALTEFIHASEIDPSNEAAQQLIGQIRLRNGEAVQQQQNNLPVEPSTQKQVEEMGAPPELKLLSNEPLTLHMTEDAKVVYQAIGKAAGINVLFDPDYSSKRIQVDLTNVSLLDALRIVGTISNTFWRPVTSNTIFVAQNTRAKHTELDEEAVQTFYLTNAWQQNDLNDMQTAIRNVLPNVHAYGVASQNAIVVRGTPDELLLTQKLIDDLDKARPEVVVDIAILEVSKNWERTLGIQWPSSVGVTLQPPTSSASSASSTSSATGTTGTTTSPTLYDLSHLKASDFAVTVSSATLNLLLNDANTKTLESPRIRATDGQKATMKIGERIPIATGSYQTGAATALVSSLVNTQFQYQDVGVQIEMTPTIHYDNDVTLKINISDTANTSSVTISGVTEPIISQRVVDQVIRLREGEAAILGGIQESQESVNWTGIPGLSSIPVLRYLFGSKDHTITNDDLVFVVVPHIVRGQSLDEANLRTIDTGPGQSIQLRYMPPPAAGVNPGSASVQPAAVLPAAAHPPVGAIPSQSATAAAPVLLQQMGAAAAATEAPPPDARAPFQPRAGAVNLMLNAPGHPIAAGSTFQVPIVLTGGVNIAAVPLQLTYDPAKLDLVNVTPGDFLSRDGQPVALMHRDDGPGSLTIHAARPPGAAGVSGAGVICVLSFQAKAAGQTSVAITRPAAVNSAEQQVQATGSQISITVH